MKSNTKLYWTLTLLSLAGYGWIGFHLMEAHHTESTLCIFKNLSGLPCPSCGVTRSVVYLLQGDIHHALWINPLGIIAMICLLVTPCWIVVDIIRKNDNMYQTFKFVEQKIENRKSIYIPMITLLLINWFWNITKELLYGIY